MHGGVGGGAGLKTKGTEFKLPKRLGREKKGNCDFGVSSLVENCMNIVLKSQQQKRFNTPCSYSAVGGLDDA